MLKSKIRNTLFIVPVVLLMQTLMPQGAYPAEKVTIYLQEGQMAYSSDEATIFLKDGGRITGVLKQKTGDSVTIETDSMKITLDYGKIKKIEYDKVKLQNALKKAGWETQLDSKLEPKICLQYREMCNEEYAGAAAGLQLLGTPLNRAGKICKDVAQVCKDLQFQFKTFATFQNYYLKAMQCLKTHVTAYRETLQTFDNDADMERKNKTRQEQIGKEYELCMEEAEALL